MKVAVVAKSFEKGGAATGARNLISALEAAGIIPIPIDAHSNAKDKRLIGIRYAERAFENVLFGPECHCLRFGPPSVNLRDLILKTQADLIQLCDISGNSIGYDLREIAPQPIVHRMSDLWPYYGAYHYPLKSQRFHARRYIADFISRLMLPINNFLPTAIISPSHWLAKEVPLVPIGTKVQVIRNAVPTRSNISSTRPGLQDIRVGFVAANVHDRRKGFDSLRKALEAWSGSSAPFSVSVHGDAGVTGLRRIGSFVVNYYGPFSYTSAEQVYRSFDILLCPSRLDNSPNVVTEAMAAGLPVIGQIGTGIESYVSSKHSGLLIDFHGEPASAAQFIVAAVELIAKSYDIYSENAFREMRALSFESIGRQYAGLYESLVRKSWVSR